MFHFFHTAPECSSCPERAKLESLERKCACQAEELAKKDENIVFLRKETSVLLEKNKLLQEEIQELKGKLVDAQDRANLDSSNSSLRPSSDFPRKTGRSSSEEEPKEDKNCDNPDGQKQKQAKKQDPDKVPPTQSLRTRSGKKPGKQLGSKGYGLSLPRDAEKFFVTCSPEKCKTCPQKETCPAREETIDTHYSVDARIQTIVTQYDQMAKKCPLTNTTLVGKFPAGAQKTKQYGEFLGVLATALYVCFNCSYDKVHQFLSGITGLPISVGWVWNKVKEMAEKPGIEDALYLIKTALQLAHYVCCDETGMPLAKAMGWIHSVSNEKYTYQFGADTRGLDAVKAMGFLNLYSGIVVCDALSLYLGAAKLSQDQTPAEGPEAQQINQEVEELLQELPSPESLVSFLNGEFDAEIDKDTLAAFKATFVHALCNQHLLRELVRISLHLPGDQKWADDLMYFLTSMNIMREERKKAGETQFSSQDLDGYHETYRAIVERGRVATDKAYEETNGSNLAKKGQALVKRLFNREDDYLRFLEDWEVPFTNNQAERDLRPHKPRQAVSGCFRTLGGLERYAKLYSILSTCRKQGISWLTALQKISRGLAAYLIPDPPVPAQSSPGGGV